MNIKSIIKNLFIAFFSQGVSLLASFLTTLILPKLVSVSDYGLWQLFIFYTTYAGVFHLGLDDGVYLKCGGCSEEELDRDKLVSEFFVGVIFQLLFALSIIVYSLFLGANNSHSYVLIFFSIWMLINNLCLFWGYILQALNRTRIFSYSVVIDRFAFLVFFLICIFAKVYSIYILIIFYCCSRLFAFIYILQMSRSLRVNTHFLSFKCAVKNTFNTIKIGINVTLAGLSSIAILGISRLLIDYKWGINAFSRFSLAFTLCNFFLTFIVQIGMVLFPALRSGNELERINFYKKTRAVMILFLPMVYILYYPMSFILIKWLPEYQETASVLSLILPVCVFDGMMNILGTTYLKVYRKERDLLKINLLAVFCSLILSLTSFFCFSSPFILVGVGVLSVAFRYIVADCVMSKRMRVKFCNFLVIELIFSCVFIYTSLTYAFFPAFMLTIILYCIYFISGLLYFKKELANVG